MGSLMIAFESVSGKEEESVRKWYHEHKEIVDGWFEE